MRSASRCVQCICLAAVLLTACARDAAPAQRAISDIDAVTSSAAPDAAQYVPDRLAEVRRGLGDLTESFERKEYAAVLSAAPAVRALADGLAAAAAAAKALSLRALTVRWSALAGTVPESIGVLQERLDREGKASGRRPKPAAELETARADLRRAESLWSKAQAAFATGNMHEAVRTAAAAAAALDGPAGAAREGAQAPRLNP